MIPRLCIAFTGHKQGAGWELGQSGHEPASIRDPGTFKLKN